MAATKDYAQVLSADANVELGVVATAEPVDVGGQSRFLEVESPATLPENYSFEVDVEGQSMLVTVPKGGVAEGQTMRVPFPDGWVAHHFPTGWAAVPRAKAPVGYWKDGLCDCFAHGVFHTWLCNVYYCPFVAIGQLLHRLQLTWYASEGTIDQTRTTFRTHFWVNIVYSTIGPVMTIVYVLTMVAAALDMAAGSDGSAADEGGNVPAMLPLVLIARRVLPLMFLVFRFFVVCKTRQHMRYKYQIPEKSCYGCEDCCCAYWCNFCTLAQMGRHTADYDTYAASCCTENGQPAHVPSIAPGQPSRVAHRGVV